MRLDSFFITMNNWGLWDIMLPFILVFTVMFAMLQKTNVLGENKKNLNMAVSLVLGLSFVVPHVLRLYPAHADPVEIINKALPQVSVVVIAVMMLMVFNPLISFSSCSPRRS